MILRPCVSMAGALLSVGCSGIVLGARKPLSTSRVRLFFGRRKPPASGGGIGAAREPVPERGRASDFATVFMSGKGKPAAVNRLI
ncbi:hypothetical protein MRX96_000098 [Rhipicephalus microplus]